MVQWCLIVWFEPFTQLDEPIAIIQLGCLNKTIYFHAQSIR